ncbi:his Kinase A domain protein [Mycobacterium xenopi 3993]|nr:his Kinase A domain protein [Mycobacterium xenopi 3993]
MLDALEASEHRAQRAAEAAQRAETATRRFLVDAAHELRTPMAGIQAAAEQLVSNASQRRSDPAARRQYRRATLLLSDARRAARLVADMLDLSRIDAGLPLDRQDCDLAGIVDTEADRTAMLAPQLTVTRTGSPRCRCGPTRPGSPRSCPTCSTTHDGTPAGWTDHHRPPATRAPCRGDGHRHRPGHSRPRARTRLRTAGPPGCRTGP